MNTISYSINKLTFNQRKTLVNTLINFTKSLNEPPPIPSKQYVDGGDLFYTFIPVV